MRLMAKSDSQPAELTAKVHRVTPLFSVPEYVILPFLEGWGPSARLNW